MFIAGERQHPLNGRLINGVDFDKKNLTEKGKEEKKGTIERLMIAAVLLLAGGIFSA